MKARSVVAAALAAGAMLAGGQIVASANVAWCIWDPPIQVVSPGGQPLMVNNQVYLPPNAVHLKSGIVEDAVAQSDFRGGTLITVYVEVPITSHVVSSVYRYQVSAQQDGSGVLTMYLHVPIS